FCFFAFAEEIPAFNNFVATVLSDVLKESKYKHFDASTVKIFLNEEGTDFSSPEKFKVSFEHTSTLNHLRWMADPSEKAKVQFKAALLVDTHIVSAKITLSIKTDVL